MSFFLRLNLSLILCAGVHGVPQVSWLPCSFRDENKTQLVHREALLQFGQKGDAPVNPHRITFLVTGSKLDLMRYLEGVEAEQVECEIYRFSTPGIQVRWPVKGDHEYSRWFTCTLKHTGGLFKVTGLLRHPTDQPPSGRPDYHSWTEIKDTDILTTTVALVTETRTPSVSARLSSKQKLHCQFAVDHKAPHVTVEWQWHQHGRRDKLFSYNSRTGQTQGSGVSLKNLAHGDASLTIPRTNMSHEGKYFCSVSVNPLLVKMEINLHIEEAPRVSLNVGPALSLQEGEEQKISCVVEGYYPLDVETIWYSEKLSASGQKGGVSHSKVSYSVQRTGHIQNKDDTYKLTASFYLTASLRDTGREFTCSVSHQSLREPIIKGFTLTVTEPSFWVVYLAVDLFLVFLVYKMLPYLIRRGKRKSMQKLYRAALKQTNMKEEESLLH
ncbi:tapasin-related protein isoform X1 [Labrus mixtus]|uniref:tapasin-related protein isoform X1 n=1 Tax=Labrus mixtus TaxID=508554 RepID=UPI0029BFD4C2|nr:tapasin-related protein isoform X1 [Labrus mixtus]